MRNSRESGVVALGEDALQLGLGLIHPAGQYQRRVSQVDEGDIPAGLDTPSMP